MLDSEVERFPVLRLTKEDRSTIEDVVAKEAPVTIILNDQELVTLRPGIGNSTLLPKGSGVPGCRLPFLRGFSEKQG